MGIAGSAAAAEDEPDVEMPAVEWLVAPIKNTKKNFKVYLPRQMILDTLLYGI